MSILDPLLVFFFLHKLCELCYLLRHMAFALSMGVSLIGFGSLCVFAYLVLCPIIFILKVRKIE